MKIALMLILVVVMYCAGYHAGYGDGFDLAIAGKQVLAGSNGVTGPFLNCKQEYKGDSAPMKNALLVSPSGEDKDTYPDDDPFGVAYW